MFDEIADVLDDPNPLDSRSRLVIYGRCPDCGAVRYGVRRVSVENGRRVSMMRLGCRCNPASAEIGEVAYDAAL